MNGLIRPYSEKKDRTNVHRIWKECGWMTDEKKDKESTDALIRSGPSLVFEVNGSAESMATSAPSRLHYAGTVLDHSAITSVTTSRIARNLGAASSTLAAMLAEEAARGFATSGLGVFEQGFYNRLGYGTGPYEHWISFDPAWLIDMPTPGIPQRFDVKNFKTIHQARLRRKRSHGAIDILPPDVTRADMLALKNTFCLGYKKGNTITHCVVMYCTDVEEGPYRVMCMAYRDFHQFRELLALIKGLGDQVRQVRMREPREIQMQDFLDKPFQLQTVSRKGEFEAGVRSVAYWQIRILDLKKCISVMKCPVDLRFNLTIEDPVARFLPKKSSWKGCGGTYTITLGPRSLVKKGASSGLETLTASISDFSRYWLGVQRAEALNVTGLFEGPPTLLEKLDAAIALPLPAPDWDY
jgi:predicted acetyltransferase